jgi:dynein heavy chain, axonemal
MEDGRYRYLFERVRTCYEQVPPEEFKKKFYSEANVKEVREWLEVGDKCLLVFAGDKEPSASTLPPKRLGRGKAVAFVKKAPCFVTAAIAQEVTFSELAAEPLEQLEFLVDAYLPILSNERNQAGWGDAASKAVLEKFYALSANVHIMSGSALGRTVLPVPAADAMGGGGGGTKADAKKGGGGGDPANKKGAASTSKARVAILEGAVITWTKQIRAVLKLNPEEAMEKAGHPGPSAEVAFWRHKAANLNSIFDQLQQDRLRKVLRVLDALKSTYCSAFARLCKEVFTARIEANDNVRFLAPSAEWFQRLEAETDLGRVRGLFRPILLLLLLVWKNSSHYNAAPRLVVLMQQICNGVVAQGAAALSGSQIFELLEAEDAPLAQRKLEQSLDLAVGFKREFFETKARADAECPENPWRVRASAMFARLDAFVERCHDLLDFVKTFAMFEHLARIEVGGTKGGRMTATVHQIHADFGARVARFRAAPHDVMDVAARTFDDEYYAFRSEVKLLDRRLVSLVAAAFEDVGTTAGRLKLLQSFEKVIARPAVANGLEQQMYDLALTFSRELNAVRVLFAEQSGSPPIANNLPPVVGTVMWCRGVLERVERPHAELRAMLVRQLTARLPCDG